MKIALWIFGALVTLVLGLFVMQYLAAERVEVVELHTLDAQGERISTRLWIVDDAGFAYLHGGPDNTGWFGRLSANETIDMTRDGETRQYRTVLRQDKQARINTLMQEKYTWGDDFIGLLVGGRATSIPIELHPLL